MAELKSKDLYDQGRFTEAFAAAEKELAAATAAEDADAQKAAHAELAWGNYRQKRYDDALAHVAAAGDYQRAKECHAHVLAYSKNHRNDALLLDLVTGVNTISTANSLMVRARDKDCNVTHEQAWGLAAEHAKGADVAARSDVLAHLLHNGGRFFLAKFRDEKDLLFALALIRASLEHYGTVKNWHHRAAALFWLSMVMGRS